MQISAIATAEKEGPNVPCHVRAFPLLQRGNILAADRRYSLVTGEMSLKSSSVPSRLKPRFTCTFAIFGMCALALPVSGTAFATPVSAAQAVAFADADTLKDLIGRTVMDSDGAPLGPIKSVAVGKAGAASTVILRYGNRDIAINWSDITIENHGTGIATHLDRNELRTMPTYRYKQGRFRGTVFHDTDL